MSKKNVQLKIQLKGTLLEKAGYGTPQRIAWEASFLGRPDLSKGDGSSEDEALLDLFNRNMKFFGVSDEIKTTYPKGYRYEGTPSAIFA